MRFWLVYALGLMLAWSCHAQPPVPPPAPGTRLVWDWTPGSGGPVGEFRMKCGSRPGQYELVTALHPDAQEVAVGQVVGSLDPWYCAVSAANEHGESAMSNEVSGGQGGGAGSK